MSSKLKNQVNIGDSEKALVGVSKDSEVFFQNGEIYVLSTTEAQKYTIRQVKAKDPAMAEFLVGKLLKNVDSERTTGLVNLKKEYEQNVRRVEDKHKKITAGVKSVVSNDWVQENKV